MINKYKTYLNLFYGSFSGTFGLLFVYPLYIYRRVYQANCKYIFSNNNFTNFFDLAGKKINFLSFVKDSIKKKGVSGVYLGMSMSLLRIGPYNGLIFLFNEKLKEWMKF
jgi:hypothetical protein